jgi:hypothetical protein
VKSKTSSSCLMFLTLFLCTALRQTTTLRIPVNTIQLRYLLVPDSRDGSHSLRTTRAMGCKQSTPLSLSPVPESTVPLYKSTSNDDSCGVKVPVNFSIGKHSIPYSRQILQASIGNKIITVKASSKLVLQIDDIVFAVAKKVRKDCYCVFQPTPAYTDQTPTTSTMAAICMSTLKLETGM